MDGVASGVVVACTTTGVGVSISNLGKLITTGNGVVEASMVAGVVKALTTTAVVNTMLGM